MLKIAKFVSLQPFAGYTLIEVLVVVLLTGLLVGGGVAAMTAARQKQVLKQAGSQLYNDLRLAQARASAGDKPEECGSANKTLDGYRVKLVGATQYEIVGVCGALEFALGMTRTFPGAVTSLTSTKCGSQATFSVLGKGATTTTYCMQHAGRYYQVKVISGGEIIDAGYVGSGDI